MLDIILHLGLALLQIYSVIEIYWALIDIFKLFWKSLTELF
jgi:hypothetical protein